MILLVRTLLVLCMVRNEVQELVIIIDIFFLRKMMLYKEL